MNSLAAGAVGLGMGMTLGSVAEALSGLESVRAGAEPVPDPGFAVWVNTPTLRKPQGYPATARKWPEIG